MPVSAQSGRDTQSTGAVLMVRPASFGFNAQTAASNAFQQAGGSAGHGSVAAEVLREFDGVVEALSAAGITVIVAGDTAFPPKPDAVFPNNWVSFHADGTVALYPMLAPNRRLERRQEVLDQAVRGGRYHVSRTVDLTHREAESKYLEGTGSLVLDRAHRKAYACLSPRTDLDVLGEFAQVLDYDLVAFEACDSAGKAVYHTNVVMAVGTEFAVVCGEAIDHPAHRTAVFDTLRADGHQILDISGAQMLQFAANLLELSAPTGRLVVLSTTAWESLSALQRRALESHARPLPVSIPTIERIGGGGVRCMLAEIHLPTRGQSANAR